MSATPLLRVRWLGRLPYAEAWDLQRAIHEGRARGRTGDDYLLLVEHPPVFTIGRNGDPANLLVDRAAVEAAGAEVYDVTGAVTSRSTVPASWSGTRSSACRTPSGSFPTSARWNGL